MGLPEFILLVIATISAIAVALAVVASHIRAARILTWISGLAFWGLGVMWSVTVAEYTLATRLTVSAVVGAIAAVGVSWVLYEINGKDKPTAPVASTDLSSRGPTFEATRDSKIDATGAVIPGDLPFQLGRADNHSVISMPGAVITKSPEGGYTVTPGNVPSAFPPPTGEFSALTNLELKERTKKLSTDLRDFQRRMDKSWQDTKAKHGGSASVTSEQFKEFSDPYTKEYEDVFANVAVSITSEYLYRLGPNGVTAPTRQIQGGGQAIYYKSLAGPQPAAWAADFLDYLQTQLQD